MPMYIDNCQFREYERALLARATQVVIYIRAIGPQMGKSYFLQLNLRNLCYNTKNICQVILASLKLFTFFEMVKF